MKSIFVSSTFRDMQWERDLIHSHVLPKINETARQFGMSVQFTDLRWGVNTEDLDSGHGALKVLSVCLENINRCKPYMIVLLGDRYGWMPDTKLIKKAVDEERLRRESKALENEESIEISDGDYEKSVTALEIECGAFSHEYEDHCFFYFREPLDYSKMSDEEQSIFLDEKTERDKCKKKLDTLKNVIERKFSHKVRRYRAKWDGKKLIELDDFVEMLTNDLIGLLSEEFKTEISYTWQQKEQIEFELFKEEKCTCFTARYGLLHEYEEIISSDNTLLFLLRGTAGSGKSTMMCKLSQTFEKAGYNTFMFICGNGSRSMSIEDAVRQTVFKLEELLGIKEHYIDIENDIIDRNLDSDEILNTNGATQFKDWRAKFTELVFMYANSEVQKKPLLLIYDALDRLNKNEFIENFTWLPEYLPDNMKVKICLSCLDDFYPEVTLPYPDKSVEITLDTLREDERKDIINGILDAQGKELDSQVTAEICKKAGADNPLYISMIIQRLLMLNSNDFALIDKTGKGMEGITKYMCELVRSCPQHLTGVCALILNEAGERINETLVKYATGLLAHSRRGLRESDISSIFAEKRINFSAVDFRIFIKYMQPFFTERADGRIDFTHRTLRDGIKEVTENKRNDFNKTILKHLKSLPISDKVRIEEIIYHAYLCNDKLFIIEYINKIKYDKDCKDIIKISAEALKDITLTYGSKWIKDIIKSIDTLNIYNTFFNFLCFEYNEAFGKSVYETEICLSVLSYLSNHIKKINDNTDNTNRLLSICLNMCGDCNITLGNITKASKYYKESLKIREILVDKLGTLESLRDISISLNSVGDIYYINGDNVKALKYYSKSLEIRRKLAKKLKTLDSLLDVSISLDYVGHIYRSSGDNKKALECYNESLEIRRKIASKLKTLESLLDVSISLDHVGHIYRVSGDNIKALECYNESLKIRRKIANDLGTIESLHDISISLDYLGNMYRASGDNNKALKCYKESLEISRKVANKLGTPKSLRDISVSLNHIGDIYRINRNINKALEYYNESLEIRRKLVEKNKTPESLTDIMVSINSIGHIYEENGDNDKALGCYIESLEIARNIASKLKTPESLRNISVSLNDVGNIYEENGDNDKALKCYNESLEIRRKLSEKLGTPDSLRDISVSLEKVGNIYENNKDTDKALECYNESLEIRRKLANILKTPKSLIDVSISLNKIGYIYRASGDNFKAFEYFNESFEIRGNLIENYDSPQYLDDYAISCYNLATVLDDKDQIEYYLFLAYKAWDELCGLYDSPIYFERRDMVMKILLDL